MAERDVASTRSLWLAWGLALIGGIGVLVAAGLIATADAGLSCVRTAGCPTTLSRGITSLAIGSTAVAVAGGLTATVLAVRGLRRGDGRDGHPV